MKKAKLNENEKPLPVATSSVAQVPVVTNENTSVPSSIVNNEAKTAPPVAKVNAEKHLKKDKPKKIKMIRDSFTMPENDYVKLAELKKKCLQDGIHVKKSELIRAGLLSLSKLTSASLLKAIAQVEVIKTGRPIKE